MLTDEAILTALGKTEISRSDGSGTSSLDYTLRVVQVGAGYFELQVRQDGNEAHVQVALPSSGNPAPWLYASPVDADDWVGQFLIFLDEEMQTAGLGPSRARELRNGASYVVIEGYGFRASDPTEHARLSAIAAPDGHWQ